MKHVDLQSAFVSEVVVICSVQFMYGMTHKYVLAPSEKERECVCVWLCVERLIDWLIDWLVGQIIV